MKKLFVLFVALIGVAFVVEATPITINIGGKIITIVPPSDLPVLSSVPTNAIFQLTIPGVTNYQVSYQTMLNWLSANIPNIGYATNASYATNAGSLGGTPANGYVNIVFQIFTNGFSFPWGSSSAWTPESSAGEALQAAINYSTNMGGGFAYVNNDGHGNLSIITSNNVINTFQGNGNFTVYRPHGFSIPNYFMNVGFRLTGMTLSADSNIVYYAETTNRNSSTPNYPNGFPPYFELDHCTLASSNISAIGMEVCSLTATYNLIHDDTFIVLPDLSPQWAVSNSIIQDLNVPQNTVTPVDNEGYILPIPCGIVGLGFGNGQGGSGEIRNCQFYGPLACDIILGQEHVDINNCLFSAAPFAHNKYVDN